MNFKQLFEVVDGMVGDVSTFKGLSFLLDEGVLNIDLFLGHTEEGNVFICEYTPHTAIEPFTFAASNEVELKDQLNYYLRK